MSAPAGMATGALPHAYKVEQPLRMLLEMLHRHGLHPAALDDAVERPESTVNAIGVADLPALDDIVVKTNQDGLAVEIGAIADLAALRDLVAAHVLDRAQRAAAIAGDAIAVIAVLGAPLPIIGHLIGGLIAGLIARGGAGRGALAGFLAGIFGGIIITILAFVASSAVGGLIGGIGGLLLGGLVGLVIGILALILSVIGAILSAIGGLIGGAIAR